MTLTERITLLLNKAIKEEKRFSQVDLARIMDIAPASINKWMSGGAPSIDKLPKLCEILNITPNELFDYQQTEEDLKTLTLVKMIKQYPEYQNIIESLLELIIKDISQKDSISTIL